MISFLKLVRIQNLLLIVLLQYFIRYYLLSPILASFGLENGLPEFHFFLLVMATALIASAGYVINDYFDLKADYINKPDSVIVGKGIKRRVAMTLHFALSGLGVLITFYLAWSMKVTILGVVPLLTVGLLWFYSTDYKRQPLIGNIVISLLAVFPVIFVLLYEPAVFRAFYSDNRAVAILIFKVIAFFSMIAFAINFLSAIVNDLHDMEGDASVSYRTMPLVFGEGVSKIVFLLIAALTLAALFFIQNLQYANNAYVPLVYILFLMEVPLVAASVYLLFSKKESQYRWLKKIMSFIMIAGVFSLVILYYFPGN